jgi:hypothetical protein
LTLTVSGDKREQVEVLHAHLFAEMTDSELETLAERGLWPERYAAMQLPGPAGATTSAAPVARTSSRKFRNAFGRVKASGRRRWRTSGSWCRPRRRHSGLP